MIAEQHLACYDCGHEWSRLVVLEFGGVTDESLDRLPCPVCGMECDPWLDGETPVPIGEGARVAA